MSLLYGQNSDWMEEGMTAPYIYNDVVTICPPDRKGSELSSQFFQGDVIATSGDKKTAAIWLDENANLHVSNFVEGEDWMCETGDGSGAEATLGDFKELLDIAFNQEIRYTVDEVWNAVERFI